MVCEILENFEIEGAIVSGFNYEVGRSNNMVAAEENGQVTIGRWAKRHGVSARAACEIMQPSEAHHTGTGRRGKSRLTPVIARETVPSADQLASMKAWDRGERQPVQGWFVRWEKTYTGPYGRRQNIPRLELYSGDPKNAPRGFKSLSDGDFARATTLAGKRLQAFANHFDEVQS